MKNKVETTIPFADPEFVEIWSEWVKYRKERRLAAYTETGLPRTLKRLVDDSGNDVRIAIKMIEKSIEMGWQGIFPLKKEYGKPEHKLDSDKLKQSILSHAAGWK